MAEPLAVWKIRLVRIEHEMGRPRWGKVRVDVGVGVSEGSGEGQGGGTSGASRCCRSCSAQRAHNKSGVCLPAFSCQCPFPGVGLVLMGFIGQVCEASTMAHQRTLSIHAQSSQLCAKGAKSRVPEVEVLGEGEGRGEKRESGEVCVESVVAAFLVIF